MATDLMTIPETRKAIRKAREVLMQPRFGSSEAWVRISKVEALDLLSNYKDDATPEHCEMYGGRFGELDVSIVYLG